MSNERNCAKNKVSSIVKLCVDVHIQSSNLVGL